MNLVRILLLVFLIYAAMKQKSEESRNVILIVTGLLAVCMMNKEGFDDDIVRLNPDSGCPASSYVPMNTFSEIDDTCVSGKVVNSDGKGCTDASPPPSNMKICVTSEGCCGSNAVCTERPLWGDSVRKDDNGNYLNVCGSAGLLGTRTKTCTCSYSPADTWKEGSDNNCADPPAPS
jgi:hypothetical protein